MAMATALRRLSSGASPLARAPFKMQELKESLALAIADASRCSSPRQLEQLHACVILSGLRYNLHLCGLLVGGYSSFGNVVTARQVFDAQRPPPTKALLWNTLIRGCLQSGRPDLVLRTFREMMERSPACVPDGKTFNLAIKSCIDTSDFESGYWIADIVLSREVGSDLLVATALLDMYSRTGDLEVARKVFDKMTIRDAVSWNAMISGYAREGSFIEAICLYKAMKDENGVAPSQATLEGSIGLMWSLEKFKPTVGCRFPTYAYWWIRQSIRKAIFQHSRTIRLPENVYALLKKIKDARKLYLQGGHVPTSEELARRVGVTKERLERVLVSSRIPVSIQNCVWTDQDVTVQWHFDSKERVRQLESRALDRLKEHLASHGLGAYVDLLVLRANRGGSCHESSPNSSKRQVHRRHRKSNRRKHCPVCNILLHTHIGLKGHHGHPNAVSY